jgi:hypothetical protein
MIKISALLFFNCVPTLSLSDKCFRRSAVSMVNQWFRQNSKSQVSTWPEKKLTMARKIHGACTISRIKPHGICRASTVATSGWRDLMDGLVAIPSAEPQDFLGPVFHCTMWGPRSIAKLVNITPMTMVYGTYNELVTGAYKPTNITGGHHIVSPWHQAQDWLVVVQVEAMAWIRCFHLALSNKISDIP